MFQYFELLRCCCADTTSLRLLRFLREIKLSQIANSHPIPSFLSSQEIRATPPLRETNAPQATLQEFCVSKLRKIYNLLPIRQSYNDSDKINLRKETEVPKHARFQGVCFTTYTITRSGRVFRNLYNHAFRACFTTYTLGAPPYTARLRGSLVLCKKEGR